MREIDFTKRKMRETGSAYYGFIVPSQILLFMYIVLLYFDIS